MAFFRWLKLQYPALHSVAYSIPNAGKRTLRQGRWLQAEGLQSGVWDVCIPIPTKAHPGLYLEFKIKPNTLTENQVRWGSAMGKLGWRMAVAYTFDEAMDAVKEHLHG